MGHENQAFLYQLFEAILACFYGVKRCVYQRQDATEIRSFYNVMRRGDELYRSIELEQYEYGAILQFASYRDRRTAKSQGLPGELCMPLFYHGELQNCGNVTALLAVIFDYVFSKTSCIYYIFTEKSWGFFEARKLLIFTPTFFDDFLG